MSNAGIKERGPYEVLEDFADRLWKLHQETIRTNKTISRRALRLYELLEDEYLQPARRAKVRQNTVKYRRLTKELRTSTAKLEKAIKDIDALVKKAEKLTKLLGYAETAIKIGAKLIA